MSRIPPLPPAFWELVRDEIRGADPGPASRQAAALRRLIDLFARGPGAQADYLSEPTSRAAYLRGFLPYEIGKITYPLGQVRARCAALAAGGELSILDAGCGPGSAALGILSFLAPIASPRTRLSIALADRSSAAVELARRLVVGLARLMGLDVAVTLHPGVLLPRLSADIVAMQGVLSEAAAAPRSQADILEQALDIAGRGLVVVVEPADRERSRLLLGARDEIVARGASVLAPCTRQGPCPALARPGDWCSMEIPLPADPGMRMGLREAAFPRHALKFSYLVLSRSGPSGPGEAASYRVVSDLLAHRGVREAYLCGEAGRIRVRLLSRSESAGNRAFKRIRRGDLVLLEPSPPVGVETLDLGVTDVVRPAGPQDLRL